MSRKKEIKLLTELLNIKGIKVISQRQHKGIGIILQLEPIEKGEHPGFALLSIKRILIR
ncbi:MULTISPECIES: hypothetical protein [Cyanophyceae]|uniref:hypothetical protein n=1 Tax=Cyanophyceae TaxID=3028117 RepID=UPI001684F683|nr:hypothetical protein [Trichocoleus sp. FACHB-40]MBD2006914.1 hypothetical protein [Trichocoleus sp. FACHB-40]